MPRHALTPVLLLLALGGAGCVSHVARVRTVEPDRQDTLSSPPPVSPPIQSAAIGSQVHTVQPPLVEERGAQPREIPVSTWRRDDEGNVQRGEAVLRTSTPWWQRFPADVVSDVLWPATLVVEADLELAPVPLPVSDPAALAERARQAGYAAP